MAATAPVQMVVTTVAQDDALDDWFRAEFMAYGLATVGAGSGYRGWAFQVCDPVTHQRLGAISGSVFWGSLNIQRLMVAPSARRLGVGSALLQHALAWARSEAGCVLASVETFQFQAPAFYTHPRHGFSLDFKREGYAHGHTFYYFSKRLDTDKPASEDGSGEGTGARATAAT